MARSPSRPKVGRTRPAFLVVHAGETHWVAVKRVGTARRFTLRVRAATRDAVLTMPSRASLKTARAFAERHAEWLGTRLGRLPDRIALVPGTLLPLRGVDHLVIRTDPGAKGKVVAHARAEDGTAPHGVLSVGGAEADVPSLLFAHLRREARRDLEARARAHAAAIGKTVVRISVRDTRSRWGSCSSRGTLNFSWRLILAPPFVLDYLAAHEVAHLAHLDHSDAFWELCRKLAPAIDEAERWLKLNGPALHRYAAP